MRARRNMGIVGLSRSKNERQSAFTAGSGRKTPRNGARQKCNIAWNNERVNDSTWCSGLFREALMV